MTVIQTKYQGICEKSENTGRQSHRNVIEFERELTGRYGFQRFQPSDDQMVDQYSRDSIFFDLSFTNFWAWDGVFHYYYRIVGDTLTVVYMDLSGCPAAILMPGPSRDLGEAAELLRDMFARSGAPLQVDYVPEEWLPDFRRLELPLEIVCDRDWSDYVYTVADFVNLEGGENKGKRRELKRFAGLGEVAFRPFDRDRFDDALEIFDRWCSWHRCRDCFYGCERSAFARVREIWDRRRFYGGLIYLDRAPAAFALGETLGGCACYSFQKNVENFRGLTYYLSYQCAVSPGHPPALNWCEDMGLEGLRENKLRYRPNQLVSKYSVRIPT